jgi:hypothetical protein
LKVLVLPENGTAEYTEYAEKILSITKEEEEKEEEDEDEIYGLPRISNLMAKGFA